jgi:hypothetical protein
LSREQIVREGVKKQFETDSFHGQFPPLFTSFRLTSLDFASLGFASLDFVSLGFSVGARKIGGSYQKSAASGRHPLPHSAGNSRGGLAIASHFSLLTFLRTEQMLKITIIRAMNKSSLFQNDSKLLVSLDRVRSHVSLSLSLSLSSFSGSLSPHWKGI